jgi:hypothetical protein
MCGLCFQQLVQVQERHQRMVEAVHDQDENNQPWYCHQLHQSDLKLGPGPTPP